MAKKRPRPAPPGAERNGGVLGRLAKCPDDNDFSCKVMVASRPTFVDFEKSTRSGIKKSTKKMCECM